MSFNPTVDCTGEVCLDDLNFTDLTCTTYDDLLAAFNNRTDLLAQALCCVSQAIPEIPYAFVPALMTIRGDVNFDGTGDFNLTELVTVDDPDNALTHISGGIRFDKAGLAIVVPEATIVSGGYIHAAAYLNGSLISDEYPNASATTADDLNAIQIVPRRFNVNDIVRAGVSIDIGGSPVVFGNLSVIYFGG